MLSAPGQFKSEGQVWTDLGCGNGTFTLALAHHLSTGSQIIAVDIDHSSIRRIPEQFQNVTIEKKVADFTEYDFPSIKLDGVLMANSLHFVQDQKVFIEKMRRFLKSNGTFLIVEYDMNSPNPWVPYPIPYGNLKKMFTDLGFSSIQKLNEKPSRYNHSNLYSAIIH